MNGDNCVCKTGFENKAAAGQPLDCQEVITCSPACGTNQECKKGQNGAANACECKTGFENKAAAGQPLDCQEVITCTPACGENQECKKGQNGAANACVCKTGFENKPTTEKPNELNCVKKCGENEVLNGDKCECKSGYEKGKDNKCVKKENNGVNGLFVILAMTLFFLF